MGVLIYRQTSNISRTKSQNWSVPHLGSNYIWVMNSFITNYGATYISGLMVYGISRVNIVVTDALELFSQFINHSVIFKGVDIGVWFRNSVQRLSLHEVMKRLCWTRKIYRKQVKYIKWYCFDDLKSPGLLKKSNSEFHNAKGKVSAILFLYKLWDFMELTE